MLSVICFFSARSVVRPSVIILFVTFTTYMIVGCPDDCTNPQQGTCDGSTGTCSCALGFGGENCAGKTFLYDFVQNYEYIKLDIFKKCKSI